MVQENKIKKVAEVHSRTKEAKSIVLVDYKGLNAEETHELRKRMFQANVDLFIEKNTLIKRVLNEMNINELDEFLVGPTALAVSKQDEVSPAKAIASYINEVTKDKPFPTIKVGYVDGHMMTGAKIHELAKLPTREILLAQVLAGFNGPIAAFARVLDAIAKEKENNNI
jgi:large subunit ribosomal protein L10